ncbi:MAG: OB-fold nucleic acid binding domain-containing protein [candidate division WOR-3 bacterium]
MKKQFVKDLKVKTAVSDIFYLSTREVKDRRDGGQFLRLELSDKTGTIAAVMWDNIAVVLDSVNPGTFVRANGVVGEYQGRLQMTVALLQPVNEREVSPGDFLAVSQYPIEEMYAELRGYFEEVTDPHLRRLLDLIYSDETFVYRFKNAPGGARVHHAYLGGLLEHTVFMLRAARSFKSTYPELNYPLLVTGIILHDIGKVDEYKYDLVIDHTLDGRLLGHVVMGYRRVDTAIRALGEFPEELARMLMHMMLRHHGEMEFGAPKTPKFFEAYLLHMIDHIDAWAAMFRETVAANPGTKWTDYNNYLETNVYIPDPAPGV